eukprot:CAMPEP_0178986620 /NCGR_PEP_ID=MMETSP0795-20121207/2803_1 /TAXON_ID=88552 /ORGANISM="Amoebophrya sp., Strain Ameob2" /LENGTH=58 /DNA_ID=CAMNT_0020677697 /DNA_START=411 /DNA_END=587 /DNA_ORIENTATION=-
MEVWLPTAESTKLVDKSPRGRWCGCGGANVEVLALLHLLDDAGEADGDVKKSSKAINP